MTKPPRPVDAWWTSETGIYAHYSAEREAANAQHRDRMKRIDAEENEMRDAIRAIKERESDDGRTED